MRPHRLMMNGLPENERVISPKISIGIVVYNGVTLIRRALESVTTNPYGNIELIVVDGGSTDGTLDVLREYAQRVNVMISEPDRGIYDAMNKVCMLATGDWLLFLGCDDELLASLGYMATQMNNSDSVYYGDVIKRSDGKIKGGEFSKYRLLHHNICHQALFYPRLVYKKYSYCLDYQWLADYAYNLELLGDEIKFVYTGVVVSIFNDEGGSADGDINFQRDQLKLIRASLGNVFFLIEIMLRLRDRGAILLGSILKRLLPRTYWAYCQSIWRKMINPDE